MGGPVGIHILGLKNRRSWARNCQQGSICKQSDTAELLLQAAYHEQRNMLDLLIWFSLQAEQKNYQCIATLNMPTGIN